MDNTILAKIIVEDKVKEIQGEFYKYFKTFNLINRKMAISFFNNLRDAEIDKTNIIFDNLIAESNKYFDTIE